MLEWFRKKFSPESIAEPEKEPPSVGSAIGSLRTEYRSGMSKMQLLASVQADTIQVALPGAMDSAKDIAALSGLNITENQFAFFGSQGFIGYQTMAMLAQNWLIAKACAQPGVDAVRKGWQITADGTQALGPDVLDAIKRYDKRMKITKQLQEYVYFGRVFGIRLLMADVISSDEKYYEKPFNPDGITAGSYRGLTQIDPYWIAPVLISEDANNPESRHFYDPTYWTVQGRKIHRSHFVVFRGVPQVPDILKPTYRYGGVSVTQQIFERVYAAERTANEAPMLAQTKRLTVLKTDVKKAMADQAAFDAAMSWWRDKMDSFGVKVIGLDDEISQSETSLADLDSTIMSQYQLVAAIARVPVTKLLGTVPKGFNATGEYDEASYHEELESLQTNDLTDVLDRHYICLIRSAIEPKFNVRPDVSIVWNPLDSMTAKEQAEVNKIKAETGNALVQAGAIDGMDERARIAADPNSGYHALPEPEVLDEEDDVIVDEDAPADGNPPALTN